MYIHPYSHSMCQKGCQEDSSAYLRPLHNITGSNPHHFGTQSSGGRVQLRTRCLDGLEFRTLGLVQNDILRYSRKWMVILGHIVISWIRLLYSMYLYIYVYIYILITHTYIYIHIHIHIHRKYIYTYILVKNNEETYWSSLYKPYVNH